MYDAVWHALLLQISGMRGHIGEQSKASNEKRCSSHVPAKTTDIFISNASGLVCNRGYRPRMGIASLEQQLMDSLTK